MLFQLALSILSTTIKLKSYFNFLNLELFPAVRCNIFVFKEKTKMISTSIWAKNTHCNEQKSYPNDT